MFIRTDVGIASEHLFYDVDYIVYCEGPEQSDTSASLDELFWTTVLTAQGIRCKCKSVGSKSNVRPIAEKVANSDLPNTIAALDRDYDDGFGDTIDHPRVVYTFGYSWENDVAQTINLEVCASLFFDTLDYKLLGDSLEEYRTKQISSLKRACLVDIAYVRSSHALFDRQKPMAIISQKPGPEPKVNQANLLAGARRIGRNNRVLPITLPIQIYDPFVEFYGKAISKLIYFWFAFAASKFASARKAPYDTFMSIAIRTANLGGSGGRRDDYYAAICSNILA